MEDNKSKLTIFRKLNSHKANLNRYKKHFWLKSAAGTFMENSNSKSVVCRRRLVKGRHNPSAYKPTSVSNSGTGEIAIDNGKLPQPITEFKGTY